MDKAKINKLIATHIFNGQMQNYWDDTTLALSIVEELERQYIESGGCIKGSIFKLDRSSSGWNASFWFRPHTFKDGEYQFQGWCGKAKDDDMAVAVALAALNAKGIDLSE